jgi:hypothetical protein
MSVLLTRLGVSLVRKMEAAKLLQVVFRVLVMNENDVVPHSTQAGPPFRGRRIDQVGIRQRANQGGNLRAHPMLLTQGLMRESAADETLKQRAVQIEAFVAINAECIRVDLGSQLSRSSVSPEIM